MVLMKTVKGQQTASKLICIAGFLTWHQGKKLGRLLTLLNAGLVRTDF